MAEHGFLEQALVYLAAGVLAVPLFKRLGLGSVLGYLAAGMAIGPWGLRIVAEPQEILQFAEFGVVMLLFLVGLELNPQRVWQMRRSILGMGAVQVAVTAAAVTGAGWLLGAPLLVSLVAGMGFAMSSTAIGLATLKEKHLLATPGGQASFSVLLFQDLAVIPLFLVLALLAPEQSRGSLDWAAVGRAVAMIALLIAVGRFGLRPLLRLIAGTGLREVFVAFSLLLVLGVAALMERVGLSMALGAFLAGVMLAESEYRHELELDIEPFKGLLLGLFFIAVGMSVDLGLFVRSPLLVLGLAAGVVLLKVVLLYPIAQTFGYCGRADATLFALGLSQVGEFAFVLFGAAGQLLPPSTLNLLNAVVAASMLSTPLLMILYERVLAPRLTRVPPRPADVIEEHHPVIVAGFGRFGQVVTRVLRTMRIQATVIDHDPTQIEQVRRFGWKAYYGDATRLDLLQAAGAGQARLLVIAIDDPEAALATVKLARQHFPSLKLIARARSRTDAFEYVALGVPAVRETFGAALDAAALSLELLGRSREAAHRAAEEFRRYDEAALARQAPYRKDVKQLIALSRTERENLERLLASESAPAPAADAGVPASAP
ncbi:MAG TPA: monovalent cation:proton antiporter-2 (CPA2) family protein [Burkholderiales bacterium]|nr:monovalent cation:proton antiporter-2 (CPA2) family protein [Burkholderiales bacterium]